MENVCKGAKKYGGVTIAITKSNKKGFVNKFIDYEIPTSLDLAFMNVLAWSSDAYENSLLTVASEQCVRLA
jgi:hypothetical protein